MAPPPLSDDACDAYLAHLPLFFGTAKFTLDPMLRVLSMCGNPHLNLPPVVHVTGTNGKGSVVAYSSYLLQHKAGLNVAAFTSPHAAPDYAHHLTVNCQPVDRGVFTRAVADVKAALEAGKQALPDDAPYLEYLASLDAVVDGPRTSTPPSQFEFITVVCLYAVANLVTPRPDVFVLEVGLGGRVDCTNVVPPPVCCAFTSVGNDHAAVLGDTPEKIAIEKSGIIKPGVGCVISYPQTPSVSAILRGAAEACGVAFLEQPSAVEGADADPASPDHANCNYRLAKGVVEALRTHDRTKALFVSSTPAAAQEVTAAGEWVYPSRLACHTRNVLTAGRFEVLNATLPGQGPSPPPATAAHEIIFDGAHNTQAVAALEKTVALHFTGRTTDDAATAADEDHEELIMVVGVLKDKDIAALAPIYARFNNARTTFYPVPVDNPRALPPAQLQDALLTAGVAPRNVRPAASISDALATIATSLRRPATRSSVVLVTGSFYLLSAARRAMRDAFHGFSVLPRA